MATCPVCGNTVDELAANAQTGQTAFGAKEVDPKAGTRQFHEDQWYYFDTLACRSKFMASPARFVESTNEAES